MQKIHLQRRNYSALPELKQLEKFLLFQHWLPAEIFLKVNLGSDDLSICSAEWLRNVDQEVLGKWWFCFASLVFVGAVRFCLLFGFLLVLLFFFLVICG